MKVLFRTIALAGFLLGVVLGHLPAFGAEVVVIPIKGEISDAKFVFLRRALKEAERENAKAVILDMDTYGGELKATEKIQEALSKVTARTVTYVNPNARSAGALIALSTKEIYMAPISAIGAAAPVMGGGQEISATLFDKTVSSQSAYFRSVAKENGHNPDVVDAFINKEKPLIINGETIHEKGSVLTLSAQEAARLVGGKPVLAAGIASSLDDLLKQAKLEGTVHRVEPTKFEHAAFWITALAPLLLMGGLLGAWLEIKTPGFGIPGIVSAICFTIFFAGHFLAGLAGWEAPVIFILGVMLVIAEFIILPGSVILGGIGLVMIFGALLLAMVDWYPGQPWVPSSEALVGPLVNFAVAGGLTILALVIFAKYLPKTALYRHIVLAAHNPPGPAFVPARNEFSGLAVGTEGVAASMLRPSGRGEFAGEPRDVITTGEFVEAGTPIRVVAVEGSRIVVQPV